MTVLIAGLGIGLTMVITLFGLTVVEASADRTRAQTAADAVALAAVAESGPHGGGEPTEVAERFAEMNGARLVGCRCPPGATAMQVELTVDGVAASARAVMDPELLMPAVDAGPTGLDPRLAAAVEALLRASDGGVHVVSGFRSSKEQAHLWDEALARYGDPETADDWVAPPGTSMHERGLAVDLGGDIDLAVRLVDELRLPLWRPMAHERWHFELVGSRS